MEKVLAEVARGKFNLKDSGPPVVKYLDDFVPPSQVKDTLLYEIRDRLFISSEDGVRNNEEIQKHKITAIINATKNVPNIHEKTCKYMTVQIGDNPSVDISEYFPAAIDFISSALADPEQRVLVHCNQGISRSASLILAYLLHSEKSTVDSALASMKAVRPYVNPNVGFLMQLREFQKACLKDEENS